VKRVVWKVDRVLLDHWKSVDESAKRQAEIRKPRLASGGRS